jgi:hypothetical protein
MTVGCGRAETPFRIDFTCSMAQDDSTLLANIEANDYSRVARQEPHGRPLAIVGGGPSLEGALEALRGWQGDIWAINRTPDYLKAHGIGSTLVSVDAGDSVSEFCAPDAVDGAIFASWCAPNVVERYSGVRIFDMAPYGDLIGSTTTAGTMAILALRMGYTRVTFFGCEGSYAERDHVDLHVGYDAQLAVLAAGEPFLTCPGFLIQCQELSNMVREFPHVFREESGGLLRGMIADPDWTTVGVSDALARHLEEMNPEAV